MMATAQVPREKTITVFSSGKNGNVCVNKVAGTGLSQKQATRMFGGKMI